MNKRLHKIGYDYCPADMMGSNPLYCLPISEWKEKFKGWIYDPSPESMLLSGIFFDYRRTFGSQQLVDELTTHIYTLLGESSIFYRFMAKDALKNPPPVSFFRNFLVESDGAHKDEFDIKNRAMAPLIGAARVLSLYHGLKNVNRTSTRYEQLAMLESENRELYESCAYAFKALLKFRVQQGLKNGDSGRFIQLESLSKSDRLKLKRCFKPLRDVQEVLRVRFQTQNLS
jgi:CBS domain-containing protein